MFKLANSTAESIFRLLACAYPKKEVGFGARIGGTLRGLAINWLSLKMGEISAFLINRDEFLLFSLTARFLDGGGLLDSVGTCGGVLLEGTLHLGS